jgi:flavin-dependent dehydrogenase
MRIAKHYDIVIAGGGLAGLTLARQLLRETDKTVLLLDRRATVPSPHQKYGEATVQLSGYYFAKVLDLEEELLLTQLPKYNLRFYWKTEGRDNRDFEDYSHAYIRKISNIPTYQLDRNTFEAVVFELNSRDPRFTFAGGVVPDGVRFGKDGARHSVRLRAGERYGRVSCDWFVDTTGRGRFLARRLELRRPNAIRHGAYYMWCDGHLNIERLTDQPWNAVRTKADRQALGHYPFWLATNHFCEEGLWFWVIPLRHKTSLGLVFEHGCVDPGEVNSQAKLTDWVCRHFPAFARDLPQRKILHFSGLADFSHGCAQTISAERWALAGEAGRFLDPLYSPGSDFIALHNTMIVDAVKTTDRTELEGKCRRAEQMVRALYEAFVPTYATSYVTLGDPETYSLKYTWELAVYFGFYVFPFINDFFTDARFAPGFLKRFSRLGRLNHALQQLFADFYRWRVRTCEPLRDRVFFDFMTFPALVAAETTFYKVGVSIEESRAVLDEQLGHLEVFARWIAAYLVSRAIDQPAALDDRAFVESLDVEHLEFDPPALAARYRAVAGTAGAYSWPFDPHLYDGFRTPLKADAKRALRRTA